MPFGYDNANGSQYNNAGGKPTLNTGYSGGTPTATNTATTNSVGAAPNQPLNPAYQGAVPTYQGAQIAGIPQVTSQSILSNLGNLGYNAAQSNVDPTVGPVAQSNVDTSAGAFTNAITAAAQPGNAQAQRALNEQLANAGVIGGGAIGAQQQLSLQEAAALQGNLQSGLLTLKGDELGQSQFNVGQTNTANAQNATNRLAQSYQNMGATNTADAFGITNRIGVAGQDATNALTAQADNVQAALARAQSNQSSSNEANQFNLSNQIKAAQGNDQTYNTFLSNAQQNANTDWLARLNAQTSLDTGGQAQQSAAFAPVYQQPGATPINFASLGAAIAPTTTTATAPAITRGLGANVMGGNSAPLN